MRKTAVFAIVMILALSLLVTGCVQKSEHDKIVADLTAKVKTAEDAGKKTKADLDAASATIKTLEPWKAIAEKFSKEVNIWGLKDGKLASSKVRVSVADKVEGTIENALKVAVAGAGMPKDAKLVKLVVKGDTATVSLSKEFKTNWPKDEAVQKATLGAIVNTVTEVTEIKKVVVTTVSGSVMVGKTFVSKALVQNDPLFTK